MPTRRNDWDDWYRPAPARRVKGGIKAHTQRGAFGETWWGRRWTEALDALGVGGRLDRGKAYARRGQVAELEISAGEVRARVQGSRAKPYRVSIEMRVYNDVQRSQIAKALSNRPLLAAQLAAGRMPEAIDQSLAQLGLPIFPGPADHLKAECSCPDWSNPCKHIAAVHYLLAEALDRNPFLLFELRGLKRIDLFGSKGAEVEVVPAPEAEPLPASPDAFWQWEETEAPSPANAIPQSILAAALPKSLGPFPFWRGTGNLLQSLEPVYETVTALALESLDGEQFATGDKEKLR